MKISIYQDRIEWLESDLLVVPVFSDERPLKGFSGRIDWRLNGKISKLILKQTISGKFGETTIFSPKSKIKVKKLFIVGLGNKDHLTEINLQTAFSWVSKTIDGLNLQNFSIPLSQFSNHQLSFERVSRIYLEYFSRPIDSKPFSESIVIVDNKTELHEVANHIKRFEQTVSFPIQLEIQEQSTII